MKKIKSILILMLAVFAVSCIEKEPDYQNFPSKDVDFIFAVQGDEYKTDFYYVSPIQFTNTSAKTGAISWDFDGDGVVDSNEANPVWQYAKAGKYNVTLSIEGVGSRTYPLQVMDIAPMLSIINQSDSLVVAQTGWVELGVELPNPLGKECAYVWEFEEGAMTEDGRSITVFEGANPGKLKFNKIGTNKITLKTRFDVVAGGEDRPLDPSFVNIQVACAEPAQTLYYASYGGNIKAYKLIANLPKDVINRPYDMGVSSGVTPQELVFAATKEGDFVYILDCGKNFIYQNDVDGVLGDGKISVMSADGTYADVVITNVGGHAFSDPFHGCVFKDNLLYTDRNNGVSSIALSARGQIEKRVQSDVSSYNFVNNNTLGFYGRGIAYGAVHSAIAVDNNEVFYWPKSYNANGIFRFRQSDIGVTDAAPCPVILNGASPKAFALDCKRGHMYVWHTSGANAGKEGIAQYPIPAFDGNLDGKEFTKLVAMDATETAGSSVEALHVSQFAVDAESGDVYFGFNPDASGETTRKVPGIYRFVYENGDVTAAPLLGTENDKVFGICINPRKTQLF